MNLNPLGVGANLLGRDYIHWTALLEQVNSTLDIIHRVFTVGYNISILLRLHSIISDRNRKDTVRIITIVGYEGAIKIRIKAAIGAEDKHSLIVINVLEVSPSPSVSRTAVGHIFFLQIVVGIGLNRGY